MLQDSHLQKQIPQNFLKAFTVFKIKADKDAKLQSTLRSDPNLPKKLLCLRETQNALQLPVLLLAFT